MKAVTCAAVAAVLALAAGCSSGGGKAAPTTSQSVGPVDRTELAAAVTTTLRTVPNHVRFSARLSKAGGRPHTQTVDAHRGANGSEQAVFDTDGAHAETRRDGGGTAWLRSAQPALAKLLPSGKTWLRLSASQLTAAGLPTIDEMLDLLYVSDATENVADHGTAVTDGVNTRVSSLDVDLGQAVCAAPESARLDIATLMNSDPRKPRTVAVRVWTDAFHLIRRMTVEAKAAGVTADYDLSVMGDNSTVKVQPPPVTRTVEVGDVPKLDRALSVPRPDAPKC